MSSGNHSAQTVHPPSKLTYKRHILGILTSPRNELYHLKLRCLSCMLITSKPSKIPLPGVVFLGLVKHICRNLEISHRCTLQHTDSHLLFQTWSKSVHDKCPKGRVVLATEKKCFGGIPVAISLKFLYASVHCGPTLIFQVWSKSVQVWGSYNRKTIPRRPK